MHKQFSVHISQPVNFCANSPESPFLEFHTRKPPPPMKKFRFEMTKVYMGIPPPWKMLYFRWPKCTLQYPPLPIALECQWGLICIPHVYHSFHRCWTVYSQWHLITETDHQPKVESVATSVLDLSIKFFKGRTSISGNSSSLQSWNIFSFCSPPVGKCLWRTEIHQQQQIIIGKYKQFLLRFLTCP